MDDISKQEPLNRAAGKNGSIRQPSPYHSPSRYGRWFHGENPVVRKLRSITPDMSSDDVAAATRENLFLIGEETCKRFAARLPGGHRLKKSVRSSVLRAVPHLGTCKFGEIVTDYDSEKYDMVQVFLANFDGRLDTSDTLTFLTPVNRDYDQMYFGLHVFVDRSGNSLGFNHQRGDDGVAFQTKDMASAFYHVASASTGLSLQELQSRAAQRSAAR